MQGVKSDWSFSSRSKRHREKCSEEKRQRDPQLNGRACFVAGDRWRSIFVFQDTRVYFSVVLLRFCFFRTHLLVSLEVGCPLGKAKMAGKSISSSKHVSRKENDERVGVCGQGLMRC